MQHRWHRAVLCLSLFLLVAPRPRAEEQATAGARFAEIEAATGARIGVSMLDTKTGMKIEHRASERFAMCSTFKFLAAAAVLQRVDQKKEDLARFVRYTEKDLLEYAPITKQHLAEGGMRLEALCAAAISYSDNTAGNLLLQTIGGPAGLTSFTRSIGDMETRLDRIEPELNSSIPNDPRDTTTPAAMLKDMHALLDGKILSAESRARLEKWLDENVTGKDLIRAGWPTGWTIGDKTGRGGLGTTNDIAVMTHPSGKRIFLAIYSTGSTASPEKRSAVVAETARALYEAWLQFSPEASQSPPAR